MVSAAPSWAEIWLVEAGGSRRPAVVLTRPEAVDRLDRVLVALATTTVRDLPSEVAIGQDEGVHVDCVLNLDTPELLSRKHFVRFIGKFPHERWPEICGALSAAINC